MSFSCATRKSMMASLAEAWSVEELMAKTLDHQFQESENPEACRLYHEHAEVSHAQKQRLEDYLKALGQACVPRLGGFVSSLKALGGTGLWQADSLEVEAQQLRTAYARAQLECAMYRALQAQATSLRDEACWRLVNTHLQEEEAHARRLWPYLNMATEAAYGYGRG